MFEKGQSFLSLGISESSVAHLQAKGLSIPTKAQAAAIPVLLRGLRAQLEHDSTGDRQVAPHIAERDRELQESPSIKTGVTEENADGRVHATPSRNSTASENRYRGPRSRVNPELVEREDVIMFGAETGSGKTFAYLAPFVETIRSNPDSEMKAIIMVPSRELCSQVARFIEEYFPNPPCYLLLSGGRAPDVDDIKAVRIVISTPSTLLTYFRFSQKVDCSDKYIVIDEADMLLSGSFLKEVESVLNQPGMKPFASRRNVFERSSNCNRLVFVGATYPHWTGDKVKSIITWMRSKYPEVRSIQTSDVHKRSSKITEKWMYLPSESDRLLALRNLLNEDCSETDKVMVFRETSEKAAELSERIAADECVQQKFGGISQLHKKMPTVVRNNSLESFRAGQCRLLVCTDLASRGLDLGDVTKIVEFDFSTNVVAYLHRIGRTARAGASGSCYHFYDDVTKSLAEAIQTRSKSDTPVVEGVFSRNRSFRRKLRKQLES